MKTSTIECAWNINENCPPGPDNVTTFRIIYTRHYAKFYFKVHCSYHSAIYKSNLACIISTDLLATAPINITDIDNVKGICVLKVLEDLS